MATPRALPERRCRAGATSGRRGGPLGSVTRPPQTRQMLIRAVNQPDRQSTASKRQPTADTAAIMPRNTNENTDSICSALMCAHRAMRLGRLADHWDMQSRSGYFDNRPANRRVCRPRPFQTDCGCSTSVFMARPFRNWILKQKKRYLRVVLKQLSRDYAIE